MPDNSKALSSIASMIDRTEKARLKFAPGTSHHTLASNRIHALHVAIALINREQAGSTTPIEYTQEEIDRARAPLASLISKSEKTLLKLAPGTWQHTMIESNLQALHIAAALLPE